MHPYSVLPPSITRQCPVTNSAPIRYITASPISSTLPVRRSGARCTKSSCHSAGSPSMVIVPGAMAFTRTRGASSFARIRVIRITPDFASECGRYSHHPSKPPISAKFTITPCPLFAKFCLLKICRAVHQNVQPSESRRHVRHQLFNRTHIRQLRRKRRRFPPHRFDRGNHLACLRLGLPVMHRHVGAFPRQSQRHCPPQPFSSARHQRHLPRQFYLSTHPAKLAHSRNSTSSGPTCSRLPGRSAVTSHQSLLPVQFFRSSEAKNETRPSCHSRPSRRRRTHLRRHAPENGQQGLSHRHPRPHRRRNGHSRHSGNPRQGSGSRGQNPQSLLARQSRYSGFRRPALPPKQNAPRANDPRPLPPHRHHPLLGCPPSRPLSRLHPLLRGLLPRRPQTTSPHRRAPSPLQNPLRHFL